MRLLDVQNAIMDIFISLIRIDVLPLSSIGTLIALFGKTLNAYFAIQILNFTTICVYKLTQIAKIIFHLQINVKNVTIIMSLLIKFVSIVPNCSIISFALHIEIIYAYVDSIRLF